MIIQSKLVQLIKIYYDISKESESMICGPNEWRFGSVSIGGRLSTNYGAIRCNDFISALKSRKN